jgi:hypothetical protein
MNFRRNKSMMCGNRIKRGRHVKGTVKNAPRWPLAPLSMIRKSGNRFSEKIMLNQGDEIIMRFLLMV